jgi:hypothetical protein
LFFFPETKLANEAILEVFKSPKVRGKNNKILEIFIFGF